VAAVCVAALAIALSGCTKLLPSTPFSPLAVRLDGSSVEVVWTWCKPELIKSIKLVQVHDRLKVEQPSDPVLWRVTFSPPVTAETFTIGSEIPGGVVTVPFAGQVTTDPSAYSEIDMERSDGGGFEAVFQVSELGPDSVFFQDRYMSKAEFARLSACPSK
jgi:hypothetical protein